jgi:hypothetical protein
VIWAGPKTSAASTRSKNKLKKSQPNPNFDEKTLLLERRPTLSGTAKKVTSTNFHHARTPLRGVMGEGARSHDLPSRQELGSNNQEKKEKTYNRLEAIMSKPEACE